MLLGVIGCVKTLFHIAHEFHDHRVAEFILPGRVARTRVRPLVRAGRNGDVTTCYRRSVLVNKKFICFKVGARLYSINIARLSAPRPTLRGPRAGEH